MASGINSIAVWTFAIETTVPNDVAEIFVNGEQPITAYKTVRDIAVFTNKRIIVRDAQGLTGKKVETYSLPYSSILMWSSENAGKLLDLNTEIELWTKAGHIKINLSKNVNIREFDRIISEGVLNS